MHSLFNHSIHAYIHASKESSLMDSYLKLYFILYILQKPVKHQLSNYGMFRFLCNLILYNKFLLKGGM